MLPTIRQIEYFIATAEAGQVSRAALMANVTQSSITIAIKGLEDLLGYELFFRTARGMQLTVQGEVFLRHAYAILSLTHEAMNLSPTKNSDVAGEIRLAVSDTISGYYLPNVWKRLRKTHPNVRLHVHEVERPDIEKGLVNRDFDLGIALVSNFDKQEPLIIDRFLSSPRRLWLSADHRLASKDKISFTDIETENYILLTMDEHESRIRKIWALYDFEPKILLRSHSLEALRSIVASGVGVAIMSDIVYRSWSLDGPRIVTKTLVEKLPPMDAGIIRRQDIPLTDAAKALVKMIKMYKTLDG